MRRTLALLIVLAAAVSGCGDSGNPSTPASAPATTSTPAATTSTPAATTSTAAPATGAAGATNSPYVVVTKLLGKPLAGESGCNFAKSFVPNRQPPAYDGGLALTVSCKKADGYTPVGQIVNRAGSKPSEITCKNTNAGQLYCLYVPSSSVGLYFTGTNRAVVRRRLARLIEVVRPLPTGVTPVAGAGRP